MKIGIWLLIFPLFAIGQYNSQEIQQWQQQAKKCSIIRDNWGVPHIYGNTDADAVFGLLYAMCEDNYWQLEEDFISSTGQSAKLYGESSLAADATVHLFNTEKRARDRFLKAPKAIQSITKAAAAGVMYYLYKHPNVPRRLLERYEPWMWLISEFPTLGQLGLTGNGIQPFYQVAGIKSSEDNFLVASEGGSNAFALAPNKTASGSTMLLINPHVAFFGHGQRYEAHLISKQGLNIAGFAFLGSAMIWSGYNNHIGWVHTNSQADKEDAWLETFVNDTTYVYGDSFRKANVRYDTIHYLAKDGRMVYKVYRFLETDHGPIIARKDSFLVSCRSTEMDADDFLLQCWDMMKARNLSAFTKAMDRRQLGYPTTTYADKKGNIAYWHGNAIPKRNPNIQWDKPVDGSNLNNDWQGLHALQDIVSVLNPTSGFIQNSNATPFLVAGSSSLDSIRYPYYMAPEAQNFRAVEGLQQLERAENVTLTQFQSFAMSTHVPMMEYWLPAILEAMQQKVVDSNAMVIEWEQVKNLLQAWNKHTDSNSIATTIAVAWYLEANRRFRSVMNNNSQNLGRVVAPFTMPLSMQQSNEVMQAALLDLKKTYGTVFIPWGSINRLQRVHSSGQLEKFSDEKPSIAIDALPGSMGALFAFNARIEKGQNKLYGTFGNSYVAVVAFTPRLKAKSVVYFGQSADKTSTHYFDQAPLYAQRQLKDAWFYKDEIMAHAEKVYHPGEE